MSIAGIGMAAGGAEVQPIAIAFVDHVIWIAEGDIAVANTVLANVWYTRPSIINT